MTVAEWSWPLLSFLSATLLVGGMLASGLARRLALDQPNARSLHDSPIPRSGGVGLMLAVLACGWPVAGPLQSALLLAAGLAGLSLLDDLHGLPAGLRLAGHLGAAAVFALAAAPEGAGLPTLAAMMLAIAWMTNLYNFMDGADGLAGGMAVCGFAFLGVAALVAGERPLAMLCFVVAAAAMGFLIFNFHPARIFLGDVGSIPLGFLAGALGLWGVVSGAWPGFFPVLVFAPFVVDASLTLARRAATRQRLWQAHREHYYQRLVRLGWSHRRLALAEYGLMAACGAAAWATRGAPASVQWGIVAAVGVVLAALMLAIDRRWRRHLAGGGR